MPFDKKGESEQIRTERRDGRQKRPRDAQGVTLGEGDAGKLFESSRGTQELLPGREVPLGVVRFEAVPEDLPLHHAPETQANGRVYREHSKTVYLRALSGSLAHFFKDMAL